MKILDCGCGLGRWTKELIKQFPNAEIIALDNKRRLPNLPGVMFKKGSIEKLPFKSNEFDLVIASRVLPYVDAKTSIAELERITKRNGLIVYELIQVGYYLKELFKGNLKRIINFINWGFYCKWEFRIFKKYDNIDSNTSLRYFSDNLVIEKYLLKSWGWFPMLSLRFTSNNKNINKQLHFTIKKIANEILEKET